MRVVRTLSVFNSKSGNGQTTTAVFLAHSWAAQGRRVVLIDDSPHQEIKRWTELAPFPLDVVSASASHWGGTLPDLVAAANHDVMVIDVPRWDSLLLVRTLKLSTDVLVPVTPSRLDLHHLPDTLEEIDRLEAHDATVRVSILLTQTISRARSTAEARQAIERDHGRHVLPTVVPVAERYAQAFGGPVPGDDPVFTAVAAELGVAAGVSR